MDEKLFAYFNVCIFFLFSRAYSAFKEHFPDQAEVLFNTMDPSCRRTLMSQSNSGSMSSLPTVSRAHGMPLPMRSVPRPALSTAGKLNSI